MDALTSVAELELAVALALGASESSGRVLGSTAERAARQSTVPVLTLRELARWQPWLEGRRSLRVLVGADGGRASEGARAFAAQLASAGACEVEVAHVVDPRSVHRRLQLPAPRDEHTLDPPAEAALQAELARGAPPGEAASRVLLPARGAAEAHLVSRCDRGDFDLLIVGQRPARAEPSPMIRRGVRRYGGGWARASCSRMRSSSAA